MYTALKEIAELAFQRYETYSRSTMPAPTAVLEDWLALGTTALSLLSYQLHGDAIENHKPQEDSPASIRIYLQELLAFYEQLNEKLSTYSPAALPTLELTPSHTPAEEITIFIQAHFALLLRGISMGADALTPTPLESILMQHHQLDNVAFYQHWFQKIQADLLSFLETKGNTETFLSDFIAYVARLQTQAKQAFSDITLEIAQETTTLSRNTLPDFMPLLSASPLFQHILSLSNSSQLWQKLDKFLCLCLKLEISHTKLEVFLAQYQQANRLFIITAPKKTPIADFTASQTPAVLVDEYHIPHSFIFLNKAQEIKKISLSQGGRISQQSDTDHSQNNFFYWDSPRMKLYYSTPAEPIEEACVIQGDLRVPHAVMASITALQQDLTIPLSPPIKRHAKALIMHSPSYEALEKENAALMKERQVMQQQRWETVASVAIMALPHLLKPKEIQTQTEDQTQIQTLGKSLMFLLLHFGMNGVSYEERPSFYELLIAFHEFRLRYSSAFTHEERQALLLQLSHYHFYVLQTPTELTPEYHDEYKNYFIKAAKKGNARLFSLFFIKAPINLGDIRVIRKAIEHHTIEKLRLTYEARLLNCCLSHPSLPDQKSSRNLFHKETETDLSLYESLANILQEIHIQEAKIYRDFFQLSLSETCFWLSFDTIAERTETVFSTLRTFDAKNYLQNTILNTLVFSFSSGSFSFLVDAIKKHRDLLQIQQKTATEAIFNTRSDLILQYQMNIEQTHEGYQQDQGVLQKNVLPDHDYLLIKEIEKKQRQNALALQTFYFNGILQSRQDNDVVPEDPQANKVDGVDSRSLQSSLVSLSSDVLVEEDTEWVNFPNMDTIQGSRLSLRVPLWTQVLFNTRLRAKMFRDTKGNSLLHIAALAKGRGRMATVVALLWAGLGWQLRNQDKQTVVQYAHLTRQFINTAHTSLRYNSSFQRHLHHFLGELKRNSSENPDIWTRIKRIFGVLAETDETYFQSMRELQDAHHASTRLFDDTISYRVLEEHKDDVNSPIQEEATAFLRKMQDLYHEDTYFEPGTEVEGPFLLYLLQQYLNAQSPTTEPAASPSSSSSSSEEENPPPSLRLCRRQHNRLTQEETSSEEVATESSTDIQALLDAQKIQYEAALAAQKTEFLKNQNKLESELAKTQKDTEDQKILLTNQHQEQTRIWATLQALQDQLNQQSMMQQMPQTTHSHPTATTVFSSSSSVPSETVGAPIPPPQPSSSHEDTSLLQASSSTQQQTTAAPLTAGDGSKIVGDPYDTAPE